MNQSTASINTESINTDPWWWQDVPRAICGESPLPNNVDVLVVGSGYTGLNAALVAVRGGRDTLVLDSEALGFGCSSRNGGQVSTSVKPSLQVLTQRHDEQLALRLHSEGHESLNWLEAFLQREQIACDFIRCGRFHAAHNTSAWQKLRLAIEREHPSLATDAQLVSGAEQTAYINTPRYFGGAFFPHHASLHPARYHQALLERVLASGARALGHFKVLNVEALKNGSFKVTTSLGEVQAKDVVMATNGYTAKVMPWLQRRVIPIGSYMIATEQIEAERLQALMPSQAIISDSRKVVYYYRKTADGKRVIFGGRVSSGEIDPLVSAPLLKKELNLLLPELSDVAVSHSWSGKVAYSFDELPHIGRERGIYYAMGYCGSGVGMASFLGMKLGYQLLDDPRGDSAFSDTKFQTRPLYRGKPWFLSPSVAFYKFRDQLNF